MHDLDWKSKRERRVTLKSYVRKFLLYPLFWEDDSKAILKNLPWEKIRFTTENKNKIPTKNGIYCFVVIPPVKYSKLFSTSYLFYIGKAETTTLKARYQNYLNEKDGKGIGKQKPRIKIEEMLNDFAKYIYFFYAILDSGDIISCEEKLLDIFMPYVNTAIPEAKIKPEYKHIY
jgi:hypothetical protein